MKVNENNDEEKVGTQNKQLLSLVIDRKTNHNNAVNSNNTINNSVMFNNSKITDTSIRKNNNYNSRNYDNYSNLVLPR